MYRLIYSSTAATDFSTHDISLILSKARKLNQRDGITGMLLYQDRRVLQVLEGQQAAVEACYGRICKDARHNNIAVQHEGPGNKPFFSDWFMGYQNPEALPPLAQIAGAKTLVTLDQLRDRLSQADSQAALANRNEVIMTLHRFMLLADHTNQTAA